MNNSATNNGGLKKTHVWAFALMLFLPIIAWATCPACHRENSSDSCENDPPDCSYRLVYSQPFRACDDLWESEDECVSDGTIYVTFFVMAGTGNCPNCTWHLSYVYADWVTPCYTGEACEG